MKAKMTENKKIKEMEHIFRNSRLVSDNFTKEGLTEVYVEVLGMFEEIQQYRAIGTVEDVQKLKESSFCGIELMNIAIGLNRLKKYEAIGTVEECQKAVEKQKKVCEPEYLGENRAIGCRSGRCICGNIVRSYEDFCSDCGSRLEWGNVWG